MRTDPVPPIDGFLQQVPQEGAPATEPTEMWVFFDDENVYVAARCLDSQPERIIANELRRDSNGIFQNDNFGVVFDTFLDRRNGFYFQTNALGSISRASTSSTRRSAISFSRVRVFSISAGRPGSARAPRRCRSCSSAGGSD